MIISEAKLSYPCIKYNIEAVHFTVRRSTAIEWVILESIKKCKELPKYGEISISAFFEQFFCITDGDKLIRPCLFDLMDMGAIRIRGIDDNTELSTVPMSNLSLTKTGDEMQRRGMLPGYEAEDVFSICYDVADKELVENTSLYNEYPGGLEVVDIFDANEIDPPFSAIGNWVSEQKNKGNRRFSWLTETTEIKDIRCSQAELMWRDVSKKIELGPGLTWHISGVDDERLTTLSLRESELGCPEKYEELPYCRITDPDSQIKSTTSLDGLEAVVHKRLSSDDICIVNVQCFTDPGKTHISKHTEDRMTVVFGAEKFALSLSAGKLVVCVPDVMENPCIMYISKNDPILVGRFLVRGGDETKDIAFAYTPTEYYFDINKYIIDIVTHYLHDEPLMLLLLLKIGENERFISLLRAVVHSESSIISRVKIIDHINSNGMKYLNRKVISPIDMQELLIDTELIAKRCKDAESAIGLLKECAAADAIRNNDDITKLVLQAVLTSTGGLTDIEDVWKIWDEIKRIKRAHLKWINKEGLFKSVYSETAIKNFISRFTDDTLYEIEEYTPIEQILLNMKRTKDSLEQLLPGLDLLHPFSDERAAEIVLEQRDKLNDIYDETRKYQDERSRFESVIGDIASYTTPGTGLTYYMNNIESLRAALALFFDDRSMQYDKVYIADTSTLMHDPEMILSFVDNKALLVIPLTVLNELDGLKSDEDEDKTYRAREAIRNIEEYRSCDWLNVGEKSVPELIPNDLDAEKNDSKILSVAVRYTAKKPILLTEDINLGNIAEAVNIQSMSFSSYKSMKENEKLKHSARTGKNHRPKKQR